MARPRFPEGFVWGAATAAYQIEGAVDEDGRGPCIWDALCQRPGAVANGDSGRTTCNHYHLWREDLDLIRDLGLKAYRFSISWPRVVPCGVGDVNPKGLDFYSHLVDGLLERGIEPFATLYHWDLPLALEERGGWRVRSTAEAYARYVEAVVKRLGDRVRFWTTFNEMLCIVHLGHRVGEHAPGAREPEQVVRQVNHHVLLAHGLGAQAIRANAAPGAQVGLVHLASAPEPFSERDADVEAAREGYVKENAWYLDPVFFGEYPQEEWDRLGGDVPEVSEGDLGVISQPLDYLGINAYSSWVFAQAGAGLREPEGHYPRTDMGWPITPDCLRWAARFTHERYMPTSIYITESGCAYPDAPNGNGGEVKDYARIAYLRSHLRGVHQAISEGTPIRGYFVWSLLDNFEWAFGLSKRFGIVHVDYKTLRRTPKLSASWYRQLAEDNRL